MNITGKKIVNFLINHPGCIKESLYPDDDSVVIDETVFLNPDDWYCDIDSSSEYDQCWVNESNNNWCDGLCLDFYKKETGYGGRDFFNFDSDIIVGVREL